MISRRRILQFSLRGFMVAVTVGCLWLGWQVEKAKRQQAAVREIREAGANVHYSYQLKYFTVTYDGRSLTLPVADPKATPPCSPMMRQIFGDDFLYRACDVRVMDSGVRKPVCPFLPRLPDLWRLEIQGVDDEDAKFIAQCRNLSELSVVNGSLSDVGLMLLSKMNLRSLVIQDCCVTAGAVKEFRSLNPTCDIWFDLKWWPK